MATASTPSVGIVNRNLHGVNSFLGSQEKSVIEISSPKNYVTGHAVTSSYTTAVTCKALNSHSEEPSRNSGKSEIDAGKPDPADVSRFVSLTGLGLSLGTFFVQPAEAAGGWGRETASGGGGAPVGVKKRPPAVITLAGYGVARYSYEKITTEFSKHWLKQTGQKVRFRISVGGSGSQARAVIDGLEADIVSLALPLDIIKIEEAGLITPGWQDRAPNNAVPAETTVCIAVRPGNPKNISGWRDLAREDLSVVTCNPKTAGVARWNFVALWGAIVWGEGKSDSEAEDFLKQVFTNVPVQPRDAREASDVFVKQGVGDALITYENEIIITNEKIREGGGKPSDELPILVPSVDVRVQTVVAIVDKYSDKHGVTDICEAFVKYVFTEPAQKIFLESGFRPYLQSVGRPKNTLPVERIWRVEEVLGDWNTIQRKFFDAGGIMDGIEDYTTQRRFATI